jgi:hypothetical protein
MEFTVQETFWAGTKVDMVVFLLQWVYLIYMYILSILYIYESCKWIS